MNKALDKVSHVCYTLEVAQVYDTFKVRMEGKLNLQAKVIENTLAAYGVLARVKRIVVAPRFVKFQLAPSLGQKVRDIAKMTDELALALGATSVRVVIDSPFVSVEVPRAFSPVTLAGLCAKLNKNGQVPLCTPVLGLDEEGAPLLISLPSPEVSHILVAGTTGSGKTELLRTMVTSLAIYNRPKDLLLGLVDLKGRGFRDFAGLPHLVRPPATSIEEAISLLSWAVEEMERRDKLSLRPVGGKLIGDGFFVPRVVIFIDELAELAILGGKEVEVLVTRLAQRGREAGIHLVVATQKPALEVIGSLARANFPVRIVGKVTTPEEAKVASGIARSGAERLLGRGDFLVVFSGQAIRFQAAYVRPEEIAALVKRR
jgi:S-DNA-T family DNA segregation ATPase FtsK/SpoIIIE